MKSLKTSLTTIQKTRAKRNSISMDDVFDGLGLDEDGIGFGAMICDMSTFRSIYRHHIRSMERRSEDAVLIMIRARQSVGDSIDEVHMMTVMNRIGAALASKLRRNDVLTGFDTSFFLVILVNTNLEGAKTVMHRLIGKINEEIGEETDIETKLQAIVPMKFEIPAKV